MRKLAFSAMFIGAFGLLTACGGGSGDDDDDTIMLPDANGGGDGGGGADANVACNPVANTGCAPDEKCSELVVSASPFLSRTDCVPDGTVPNGGACTDGEPGETTGFDDCEGGNLCVSGICTEICSTSPDSCADGATCVLFANTFDDVENVGLCQPTCDPLAQDCADMGCNPEQTGSTGTGCYFSGVTGEGSCACAFPEDQDDPSCPSDEAPCVPGTQQDQCNFLNTCDIGFGCLLNEAPGVDQGVCVEYCDAMDGDPGCSSLDSTYACLAWNMIDPQTSADPSFGVCIDCAIWDDPNSPDDDIPGCPQNATAAPSGARGEGNPLQGKFRLLDPPSQLD